MKKNYLAICLFLSFILVWCGAFAGEDPDPLIAFAPPEIDELGNEIIMNGSATGGTAPYSWKWYRILADESEVLVSTSQNYNAGAFYEEETRLYRLAVSDSGTQQDSEKTYLMAYDQTPKIVTFREDEEGWNSGGASPPYTLPDLFHRHGKLCLISKDSNTFGYWSSPAGVTELDPAMEQYVIYRLRYLLKTDVNNPAIVPDTRIRMNRIRETITDRYGVEITGGEEGSACLNIHGITDGVSGVTVGGRYFDLYFYPRFVPKAEEYPFYASVDMLNFSPYAAELGKIELEEMSLLKHDVRDLSGWSSVQPSYTFSSGTDGWTFSGPITGFTCPNSGSGGYLSLESTTNTNTFGYWQSPEIGYEHDYLYRATCMLRTDVTDREIVPGFRLRFFAKDNEHSSVYSVLSSVNGWTAPTTTAEPYVIYFAPPDEESDDNRKFLIAFDMTNFDPNDSATGTIFLDEVTVEKTALANYPAPLPDVPVPLSPPNNEDNVPTYPTLTIKRNHDHVPEPEFAGITYIFHLVDDETKFETDRIWEGSFCQYSYSEEFSVHPHYNGGPLPSTQSHKQYFWRVKARDSLGQQSGWSVVRNFRVWYDTDGDGIPDDGNGDPDNVDPSPTDPDAYPPPGNGVPDGKDDFDGDGLSNEEEFALGTKINVADSDYDGLSDGVEFRNLGTLPLDDDSDDDGVLDGDEYNSSKIKSDPLDNDSDGDGLWDGVELGSVSGDNKLNPMSRDTDSDGVSDYDEYYTANYKSNNSDADLDGIPDGVEICKTNPIPYGVSDGLKLQYEGTIFYDLKPFLTDADPSSSTNPKNSDTDSDGKSDSDEDFNKNGRLDRWEFDPETPDTEPSEEGACNPDEDIGWKYGYIYYTTDANENPEDPYYLSAVLASFSSCTPEEAPQYLEHSILSGGVLHLWRTGETAKIYIKELIKEKIGSGEYSVSKHQEEIDTSQVGSHYITFYDEEYPMNCHVNIVDVDIDPRPAPDQIPRAEGDPPVTIGYQLEGATLGRVICAKMKIYDPRSFFYIEIPFAPGSNTIEWDGKVFDGGNKANAAKYPEASDVWLNLSIGLSNTMTTGWLRDREGNPEGIFQRFWDKIEKEFSKPRIAITKPKRGEEIEAGAPAFDCTYGTWRFDPTSYQWDLMRKAFDPDVVREGPYEPGDILELSELQTSSVRAKYITGSKAPPGTDTDLGPRKITLSASDGTKTLLSSTNAEVVIHSAKITFYYTPYENNDTASWWGEVADKAITIDNPRPGVDPSTIYVPEAFRQAIGVEGNGRLYKIRDSEMGFELGDDPIPDGSQDYLHWVSGTGDAMHCEFKDKPQGYLGPLSHQNAARFECNVPKPSGGIFHGRSYYNLGQGTPYEVVGLMEAVNAKLRMLSGNKPMDLQGDVVVVNNTGPFGGYDHPLTDEKHLDIYLQEKNTDKGIDPYVISELGVLSHKVQKENPNQ